MSKFWIVVVVLVVALYICARSYPTVGGDGADWVFFHYQEGGVEKCLAVGDEKNSNGIFIDVLNKQILCQASNTIIKLPKSMEDYSKVKEPTFSLSVEYICKLGQEEFDDDMEIILGISSP